MVTRLYTFSIKKLFLWELEVGFAACSHNIGHSPGMVIECLDFLSHWNLAGYHSCIKVAIRWKLGGNDVTLSILVVAGDRCC